MLRGSQTEETLLCIHENSLSFWQWDAVDWTCVLCDLAFTMTERADKKISIKFYIKPGHSSVENIRRIKKAFGDDPLSEAQLK